MVTKAIRLYPLGDTSHNFFFLIHFYFFLKQFTNLRMIQLQNIVEIYIGVHKRKVTAGFRVVIRAPAAEQIKLWPYNPAGLHPVVSH